MRPTMLSGEQILDLRQLKPGHVGGDRRHVRLSDLQRMNARGEPLSSVSMADRTPAGRHVRPGVEAAWFGQQRKQVVA